MNNESNARTWVRRIALGFLCVSATVTFAIAGGHRQAETQAQPRAQSSSGYVPSGMHEAQADVDVGPGSDEAQLAASSWAE
jgi:hypothetical protein